MPGLWEQTRINRVILKNRVFRSGTRERLGT
jgi:hypothetical protein